MVRNIQRTFLYACVARSEQLGHEGHEDLHVQTMKETNHTRLRPPEDRVETGLDVSRHFDFTVEAPNLYDPPFAFIFSAILAQGILLGFCFASREGCE
jgi:hypothetical protein